MAGIEQSGGIELARCLGFLAKALYPQWLELGWLRALSRAMRSTETSIGSGTRVALRCIQSVAREVER